MNEDLAKQLANILNDKNIDLNQIIDNFKANSSGENTENGNTPTNNNSNNNNNNNSTSSNQNESSSTSQFDVNTILKMQKILSLMNNSRKHPRRNTIKSIKTIYEKLQKRKNRSIYKTSANTKNIRKIQRNGRKHK